MSDVNRAMCINYPGLGNMKSQIGNCLIQHCNKKHRLFEGEEESCEFEFLNGLADHLLIEVLMRLPSKCAYRCKAVCKRWHSLMSTSSFISCFIDHHSKKDYSKDPRYTFTLLFQYEICHPLRLVSEYPLQSLSLSFNPTSSRYLIRHVDVDFLPGLMPKANQLHVEEEGDRKTKPFCVRASCHDLLLCSRSGMYYVVNWHTKQWIVLPRAPTVGSGFRNETCTPGLLCCRDLSDDVMSNGFRFKVILVCAPKKSGSRVFNVRIFCSKARQWSKVNVKWYPWTIGSWLFSSNIVAHNGKLHWINGHSLVSLDLLNGDPYLKLYSIKLPNGLIFKDTSIFGVCHGRFRFAQYVSEGVGDGGPELVVWELMDYHKGVWQLVNRTPIRYHSILGTKVMGYGLLAFNPDDKDVIFMHEKTHIYLFNIKTKALSMFRKVELCDRFLQPSFYKPVALLLPQWFPTPVSSPIPLHDTATHIK